MFENGRPILSIGTAPRSCGIPEKAAALVGGSFTERPSREANKRPPECRFRARGVRAALAMAQALPCIPQDPKRGEFEAWLDKARSIIKKGLERPGPRAEVEKELGLSAKEIRRILGI